MGIYRPLVLILAVLAVPAQASNPPRLVRDIERNAREHSSSPYGSTTHHGKLYFMATDGLHGNELWKTDGTTRGTRLVKDIYPGPGWTSESYALVNRKLVITTRYPSALWISNGTAAGTVPFVERGWFFARLDDRRFLMVVDDPEDGGYPPEGQLWVSDGTRAGTEMLLDLRPSWPVLVNDKVYFTTDRNTTLWVSDGEAGGTRAITELAPTYAGPFNAIPVREQLLFRAKIQGLAALWATDGHKVEALLGLDGRPYADPLSFSEEIPRGRVFLRNRSELWITDGTKAGTVRLERSSAYEYLTPDVAVVGGLLYQKARDVVVRTDGRPRGTVRPPELQSFSDPRSFLAREQALLLLDNDKLWAVNGPGDTPRLLASDLNTPYTYSLRWGPEMNGYRFFATEDQVGRTDGTAAGTRLIGQLPGSDPSFLRELNGEMFLRMASSRGAELWAATHQDGSLRMVRDIWPASASSNPVDLLRFRRHVYFKTSSPFALWRSNGTKTRIVEEERIDELAGAGDHLFYLLTEDYEEGPGLWVTDGRPGAARLLIPPESARLVGELAAFKNQLFFSTMGPGQRLWRSDGTAQGTVIVRDINPESYPSCDRHGCYGLLPSSLRRAGPFLYFVAKEGTNEQLWRSDATTDGTIALADFPVDQPPEQLTALRRQLIFLGSTAASGRELWRSFGDPESTRQVVDLTPGPESSDLGFLTRAGAWVFFVRRQGHRQDELWRTRGHRAVTEKVSDLTLDGVGSTVREVAAVGRRLFLAVDNETTGRELWVSDGTDAGTHLVQDIHPGRAGSWPRSLSAIGDRVVFAADDGVKGYEPWISDGTPQGTCRLADVAPGRSASTPGSFQTLDGQLFFTADDGKHGRELFSMEIEE